MQFVYFGKKAALNVGNVLPLASMPEGTIVCNVEHRVGDRGVFAKASGDYAIVIAHNPDTGLTRIKLPSGSKKVVSSASRAMVGQIAGGGRLEKPLLKAGVAYHKYKAKRHSWPKARLAPRPLSTLNNAYAASLASQIVLGGTKRHHFSEHSDVALVALLLVCVRSQRGGLFQSLAVLSLFSHGVRGHCSPLPRRSAVWL